MIYVLLNVGLAAPDLGAFLLCNPKVQYVDAKISCRSQIVDPIQDAVYENSKCAVGDGS